MDGSISSAAQVCPLPEGFRLEGYRIESHLSTGGFSMSYLARDEADSPFVIKEYLPARLVRRGAENPLPIVAESNRAAFDLGLENFCEEAGILARIDHPNVVKVVDLLRANRTAYVVTRHEAGHSLQDVIRLLGERGEPMREDLLRYVFVPLLGGLHEVHESKLLHLDIQPANIYLRKSGQPVLINFGASRLLGLGDADTSSDAATGSVYTPGFAAPEQEVPGAPTGPWTDIYAVGATLYACLSGRPPMAARLRHKADTLEQAQRRWFGQYSAPLLELIDWCMRLDATRRPQSVLTLQTVLRGELLDLVDPAWFADPEQ